MELFGNKKHKKDPSEHVSGDAGGKKGRKRGALRTLLTVIVIVAVVALAVVVGYSIWEKPPEIGKPSASASSQVTPPAGEAGAPALDSEEIADDFAGALDTDRDDGIYTFLLVGRDRASNSTDTIIAGKVDTVNHTIDCINIPRDTLINISWSSTPKKINAVYPGYTNSGKSGVDGLKAHIKKLVGFDIDCYAIVDLTVVEDVINEIGGVYFDVPLDMDYDDGSQHFHVHLKSGYQLLNGYETLGVFRYRYGNDGNTYPGGDLERIGVQQSLLKAIASQMLTLGNIPNLTTIIQLLIDNVQTDLDASNMAFFARQFLLCSSADINFHTAPYTNTCWLNSVSYVSLDVDAWLDMVNEYLNPYSSDVTAANVDILTSNYDGSSMTATTGAIAGGVESFFCQSCALNGYGVTHHAPGSCPVTGYTGGVQTEAPETGDDSEAGGETQTDVTETPDESTDTVPEESEQPAETPFVTEVVVG